MAGIRRGDPRPGDPGYFDDPDDSNVSDAFVKYSQKATTPSLPKVSTQQNFTTPTAANISKEAAKVTEAASTAGKMSSSATSTLGSGSSVVGGISKTASGVTSGASGALNSATGMANGAINTATGVVNTGMQMANSAASQATNAINSAVGALAGGISASSILGIPADIALSAFQNTAERFKDNKLAENTNVGNFCTGLTESMTQFSTAMKSATNAFTSEVQNLTKKGLTFIASTTGKMVDGIDLPGLSELKNFSNMGLGQLGKLASMGSEALESAGKGLKAVVGTLSDVYQCGKQALDTVTQSVAQVGQAVIAPAVSLAETAYTLTDPRTYGAIVQENLSFLPAPLQNIAGQKAAQAVASLTGNVHKKAANILNKTYAINSILDIGATESMLDTVSRYGNGYGSYGFFSNPMNFNISGYGNSYIPGVSSYSGGNKETYGELARAVAALCGDLEVDFDDLFDFNSDQDLFDILLQLAMQTNAGMLLKSILNCVNGQDYYSGRSTNLIRDHIGKLALTGDTYSYNVLLSNRGSDVVKDPKQDVLALYTNARADEQSQLDLKNIMKEFYMEQEDVINTEKKAANKYPIIDSAKATVIQKAEDVYKKQFLSPDDYASVNAALALYG